MRDLLHEGQKGSEPHQQYVRGTMDCVDLRAIFLGWSGAGKEDRGGKALC